MPFVSRSWSCFSLTLITLTLHFYWLSSSQFATFICCLFFWFDLLYSLCVFSQSLLSPLLVISPCNCCSKSFLLSQGDWLIWDWFNKHTIPSSPLPPPLPLLPLLLFCCACGRGLLPMSCVLFAIGIYEVVCGLSESANLSSRYCCAGALTVLQPYQHYSPHPPVRVCRGLIRDAVTCLVCVIAEDLHGQKSRERSHRPWENNISTLKNSHSPTSSYLLPHIFIPVLFAITDTCRLLLKQRERCRVMSRILEPNDNHSEPWLTVIHNFATRGHCDSTF